MEKICNYELASELHYAQNGYSIIMPDEIKRQVSEIQKENTNEALGVVMNEAQAFAKWLKEEDIFEEYLETNNEKTKTTGENMANEKTTEPNGIWKLSSETMSLADLMQEDTSPRNQFIRLGDGDNMFFTIPSDAKVEKKLLKGIYGEFTLYEIEIYVKRALLDGKKMREFKGIYGFKLKQINKLKQHDFKGEFKIARQGMGQDTSYIIEHETDYNY